jgi:DNA-binding Lrp family transcriptional regulator
MQRRTPLADFLFGPTSTRRSLLSILFSRAREEIHLRELARQCGVSPPAVAKEIAKLLGEGVVLERVHKNTRLFQANMKSALAADIQRIVRAPTDPRKRGAVSPRFRPDLQRDAKGRRPSSLQEAAAWGRKLGSRDAFLREFLDEFYVSDARQQAAMIEKEPALDVADNRANAYYAAVAEHLALRNDLAIPRWAIAAERFLSRPFFPSGLESLKATSLVESPTAFRRRMIFVGADPLSRPRRVPARKHAP